MTLPISKEEANIEGIIAAADGDDAKYCADCKHLLGVRHHTEDDAKWKCVHPNNLKSYTTETDLVTGLIRYKRVYWFDSIATLRKRNELCGSKGNWYEKYLPPVRESTATIGGKEAIELTPGEVTFSPDNLKAQREAAERRLQEIKDRKRKKLTDADLGNL